MHLDFGFIQALLQPLNQYGELVRTGNKHKHTEPNRMPQRWKQRTPHSIDAYKCSLVLCARYNLMNEQKISYNCTAFSKLTNSLLDFYFTSCNTHCSGELFIFRGLFSYCSLCSLCIVCVRNTLNVGSHSIHSMSPYRMNMHIIRHSNKCNVYPTVKGLNTTISILNYLFTLNAFFKIRWQLPVVLELAGDNRLGD